jgi:hypothetical protein
VWVFQDAQKTDCGSATTIAAGYTQPFVYDDIVNRCRLQINGQDRFDERYGDYFWKVQPYQHHSGGGFWPTRQETNAVTVTVPALSASFTLSAVGTTTHAYTGLTGVLLPGMVILGAGATGYSVIVTSNLPTSATAGTFTSTSFTSTATTYTASFALEGSTQPAASGSASASATTTYQVANPINVYSFALQPEEHQPSGTCNFSRIDTTTLVFDSFKTGTYPTKSRPFNFRMYAVNYNIFRVMSGMGGLAYSN